jgi:tetratricopeptide (TPR) repeat protein
MRFPPWILCLWPGLPGLWLRGKLSALALAAVFAGLLQGMMLTSFAWPESATPAVRLLGWLTAACVWLASAAVSARKLPSRDDPREDQWADALFREAQTEYLNRNWYRAQVLLEQLLERDRQDVDAGLMLASLYRHVDRTEQAREQLRRLQRLDASAKWGWEIHRELEYLDRMGCDEGETSAGGLPAALADAA